MSRRATAGTLRVRRRRTSTAALDLVARMLRLIGEVPVLPDQPDLDTLRHTCEAWARHVLTGAGRPGTPVPR